MKGMILGLLVFFSFVVWMASGAGESVNWELSESYELAAMEYRELNSESEKVPVFLICYEDSYRYMYKRDDGAIIPVIIDSETIDSDMPDLEPIVINYDDSSKPKLEIWTDTRGFIHDEQYRFTIPTNSVINSENLQVTDSNQKDKSK